MMMIMMMMMMVMMMMMKVRMLASRLQAPDTRSRGRALDTEKVMAIFPVHSGQAEAIIAHKSYHHHHHHHHHHTNTSIMFPLANLEPT